MNNRWGVFLLILFLAGVSRAAKPNIVLVMADDQGWGDMAYNGHPKVKTPHFDAAAAAGLRFDRWYAAAPVCSPTRASVLTGRHPNRMGVFKWGYPMRPQEITIAEALKTAGYATGHFGKWHLGSVRRTSPASPGANGFDRWVSAPNFYDNDAIMSDGGKAVAMKGESSFIAVDPALEWIAEQAGNKQPFLAVVWFGSPHSPHLAVEEDRRHYDGLPKGSQHFLGEVTGMDRAFGKLRDGLQELGIRDNTILWYTSDNGALPRVGSAGKFRGNKGKVYEGGLLVPAILEWPARITKPRVTDARCNSSDLFPTLLEIAGVTERSSHPLDGVSLVPLIDGGVPERAGMGFWDYDAPGIRTPSDEWMTELAAAQQRGEDLPPHESSVRAAELPDPPRSSLTGHAAWISGDWKLHRIGTKGNLQWELYNLKEDPAEERDLASGQPERAAAMKKDLLAWMNSVKASLNGRDYTAER